MPKNISLLGADYPNVPAVVLPQTGGGSATFTDVSGTTATDSDVLSGKTFFTANGQQANGSLITHNVYDGLDSTSTSDALSANQGRVLNGKIPTRNTYTVTKGSKVNSIDIHDTSFGKVHCVSGYMLLDAGTYSGQDTLFTVSAPAYDIYGFDDKGDILRIQTTGNVIYHNGLTLGGGAFRFFNISYIVS